MNIAQLSMYIPTINEQWIIILVIFDIILNLNYCKHKNLFKYGY